MPRTTKQIGELQPGDFIILDIPCKVQVRQITQAPRHGETVTGNTYLIYDVVEVGAEAGMERIGSKVSVVWLGEGELSDAQG